MDPPAAGVGPGALTERELLWLRGLPTLNLFALPDAEADAPVSTFIERIWPSEVPLPRVKRNTATRA